MFVNNFVEKDFRYISCAKRLVKENKMVGFKTLTTTICLITVLSLSVGLTARVHANNDDQNPVTFFKSASNAEARWVHFTPPPPADPDTWSIKLLLDPVASCFQPNYVNCPYAGADLNGVAGTPPTTPPSYDYYSTVSGPGGGSPRLVMVFSDSTPTVTSDMELRPLNWVAGVWAHESGSTTDWDVNGGTCGFLYAATYNAGLLCHAGKTVTDVFVVTDSAWQLTNPNGYTHYIDNISYGSTFITSPQSGCQESDGNGDFQGQQSGQHGNFNFDNDGCIDGDQNQVSSTNRGDGKDFQSTQINTASFDPLANTITITGVGTSGGVPVAFTFVALETGLTTPGWVSFAFSDGYTNAGTLVNGSVLLH